MEATDETTEHLLPHPLDASATLDALVISASSEEASTDKIVEDLSWQTIVRMMCEIREVPGLPSRFTGASVVNLRVDKNCRRLLLTLAGSDGSEIESDNYHAQCICNSAFKGFSFLVLTVIEDRVGAVDIHHSLLKYRLVHYRPAEHVDFALCLLIAFLENCPRELAKLTLFVQVKTFLQTMGTRITPLGKLRRLLYVTATWLLNTLMDAAGTSPFDSSRILPHYYIHRYLSASKSTPAVLTSLYEDQWGRVESEYPASSPRRRRAKRFGVRGGGDDDDYEEGDRDERPMGTTILSKTGLLNQAFRGTWISDQLYAWWKSREPKLSGDGLFYRYE
ncbi:tegument protein UL7 [Falconid herpesvirus 1]|uniref:Tegument protein UL7 n=2 Tax=Columbid alphaherpesvirus 1 TaxID=93386 RepID=A0A068ER09_9ALPH|nr:tegument protein UL7 [Falconid herpesvirus 1]YP_009352911.1 tegument protein UL7 [Columbid alphaherpesvirus 1]AID52707.1 tegument protein UL7 [Falconid herpesvirus 1]ARD71328.1 tegument protein UL7 [Columbid alphaherpesvirus 1]